MTSKEKHIQYHVSLAIILILGLVMMYVSRGDHQLRMIAILMTSFFYVVWGVVHHILHHDTSVRIVVEYVLIAVLGVALALLVH